MSNDYIPLTEKDRLTQAFKEISKNWKNGSEEQIRTVSWRPESKRFSVWWRPKEKIWAVFQPWTAEKFHWIFAGLSIEKGNLHIDCQFNPQAFGFSRRIGGVFLEDGKGHIYLGHTGVIGGGKTGVGRNHFIEYCRGKTDSILWPDGIRTEGFCICNITSKELPAKMRNFASLRLNFISKIGRSNK